MEVFDGLTPGPLWQYFGEICRFPRLSGKEEPIIEYLLDFAGKKRLQVKKDGAGNLVIRKPAFPGREHLKKTILQSHLDMVGEKDRDSQHDFSTDPIVPVRDGDWIKASGTTLGADDGIGIAAQMAILSDTTLEHGPVECLFTVDEETGMTGAGSLEHGFVEGNILLNLDSEDWGELFIGCAGGMDTLGTFRFGQRKPEAHSRAYKMSVSGLNGGHSGDEIHKRRGNAIKILNRILLRASREHGLALACFEGGNLRNAIPREASAVFTISPDRSADFEKTCTALSGNIRKEMKEDEPDLLLELEETDLPDHVLSPREQAGFLQAIEDCPHGVIGWSPVLDNLVETSTNLASVKFTGKGQAVVATSQRSSVESSIRDIADRVGNCLYKGGAEIEHTAGYPGWTPDTDSEILGISVNAYRELFGEKPVVRAIHAGLECGLILEKYQGLDMLSFGPTIKGAHTPSERLHTGTTQKFWKFLVEVLKRIPEQDQ